MSTNQYELAELAGFARKGEIPAFLYSKNEGAKELLLAYPRSLRNWAAFLQIPLLIALVAVGFYLLKMVPGVRSYFSDMANSDFKLAVFVLSIVVVGLVPTLALQRIDYMYRSRKWKLEALSKQLYTLTKWLGCTPAKLEGMRSSDLVAQATWLMVEACKNVLITQRNNAGTNPSIWVEELQNLNRVVKTRYDFLLSMGLLAPGGYEPFYQNAREQIASS